MQRLGVGGGFFSFGIMHYYMTGMHTPGRTGVWDRYLEEVKADPTLAYGPGRGAIGSPDTVREFLRGYEESGVDEIILLLNPRSHEGTMESIELMGKHVLPEFIERDEKHVAAKNKRLEPVLEKLEKRREASLAPEFDEDYSFGGLAHRPGRKVHRQRDPRGHGRDQRGSRAGRATGEGAAGGGAEGRRSVIRWASSPNCSTTAVAARW